MVGTEAVAASRIVRLRVDARLLWLDPHSFWRTRSRSRASVLSIDLSRGGLSPQPTMPFNRQALASGVFGLLVPCGY